MWLHPTRCLKHVTLYLRETKDWGIVYWHPQPYAMLPSGVFKPLEINNPTLPEFPSSTDPFQLVNALHAMDIKARRSVTGFILILCGGAICY